MGEVAEAAAIVDRAWKSYWRTKSLQDRNWLVEVYAPQVRRVARYFPNVRKDDREDLEGVGYVALVKAVEDWKPELMPWDRFLQCKLRYAMVDHIRRVSWVPKGVREVATRVEDAEEAVHKAKGRAGTRAEVAEYLGLTEEQLAELESSFRTTDWTVASLDHCSETEAPWVESILDPTAEDPEHAAVRREEIDKLELVLQRLPGRLRQVLRWAYFSFPRVEQREIAQRLGVHESRVSQMLKTALDLARKLRDQPCLFSEELIADNRMTSRH